ncbi:permease [Clostridium sp. C2-6-12]|uniref:permease n=1 Tax=Clostridium sp. C2-6-12 TaxID=2698832 RepID=UPI001FAD0F29|nr:permease [Clostridium sp. C2-6-12]
MIFLLVLFFQRIIETLEIKQLGDFANIFISIILEAMPFIILGSFISAIIQIFISEERIVKLIPRINIFGYFGAALIGLIFPVCECAIVPITRSLIKKGMPIGMGITLMLSVPIINPVVIMSTYYAFYDKQVMVLLRVAGGFVAAILIGIIVNLLKGNEEKVVLNNGEDNNYYCSCGCNSFLGKENKLKAVFEHTNREFINIMGYLIFGAFISSGFQVIQAQGGLNYIFDNKLLNIVFMMFLGFALSLCSEADAFVGRTFLEAYSFSGVAAFLLLGPMLDFKNLIILLGAFKKNFVFKLAIVTISIVFIICSMFLICGI